MSNDNMPASVLAQDKRATELLKAMDQQEAEATTEIVTFDKSEELEVAVEEAPLVTSESTEVSEEEYIEQDTLESQEEDNQPSYDELQEMLRKEQARYKSIQGKYNKEGQRGREEIEYLKAQLAERPVLEPTSVQTETNDDDDFSYLSESEKEAYDLDFLALQRKIARKEAKGAIEEVKRLKKELADKEHQQQQNQLNDTFTRTLSELSPNWSELNADPDFNDWLDNTTLPIVGNARDAMMKFDRADDVYAVAEIFNSYKPLGSKQKKGLKVPPSQLSPPKATSSKTITTKPKKNTYTNKVITKFYKDYAQGEVIYNGRKLTKDEMEFIYNDIDAAQREGRIKN